jgi:hypothetical protein
VRGRYSILYSGVHGYTELYRTMLRYTAGV